MHDPIVRGIATILWASAWSTHADEHRCCSLSGRQITDIMPPIPPEAWARAERLAGRIEGVNGSIAVLLWKAAEADGMPWDHPGAEYAQRFGECLAYMAMGDGVSWFDDHAQFPLRVPYDAGEMYCELMHVAETGCRKAKRRARR